MDAKGRPAWRSPAILPKHPPAGVQRLDHVAHDCPSRWPAWIGRAVDDWLDFDRYGSLPEPGSSGDQSARTLAAFALLSSTGALITAALQEREISAARKRAEATAKARAGR